MNRAERALSRALDYADVAAQRRCWWGRPALWLLGWLIPMGRSHR
jgi:hypothetical protein